MTIEMWVLAGFVVGLIFGLAKPEYGCMVLAVIPVAMFAYIWWCQSQNPDALTSTSVLNFVFGPLWPTLGARGVVHWRAAVSLVETRQLTSAFHPLRTFDQGMAPPEPVYSLSASERSRASSTSTPRYLTVLSSLVWPRRSWQARKLPVFLYSKETLVRRMLWVP